jgi:hypothetical protein
MTRLDWLKFVGCYAAGMVLMVALDYLFQWKAPGNPLRSLGAVTIPGLTASGVVTRANGSGNPLPRPLLFTLMGALAALGAIAAVLVWVTVGWHIGLADALVFAAVTAILWPLVVNSKSYRTRAAAAANGQGDAA